MVALLPAAYSRSQSPTGSINSRWVYHTRHMQTANALITTTPIQNQIQFAAVAAWFN